MRRPVTIVLAAAAALAGCSSSSSAPGVATLPAGAVADPVSSSVSSPASAEAGVSTPASRPRERLDMTDQESDALYAPYNACLDKHGMRPKLGSDGKPAQGAQISPGQEEAARKACAALSPLPPWEYDENNPHGRDFVQAVVDCLHHKGVKYVEMEAEAQEGRILIALGGPNNDPTSISRGMDLIPQCEREASAAKR